MRRWKDREHACQNRQTGHSRGFWDDDETGETVLLLSESFPIRGTSQQVAAYFDRESGRCSADRERSEKLSDRANPKRGAKEVRGKGENRTS